MDLVQSDRRQGHWPACESSIRRDRTGAVCAMVLADLGADVVRIARPGQEIDPL
jgi:hypothetical protein